MNRHMERNTLLEKYLLGALSEKEREEFDTLLEKDPKFKEELEFQIDVKRAVTAEEDADFLKLLSEFETETADERHGVKRIPTKWLVAASIALLATLTYFFTLNQTVTTGELYAQNFEPYPNLEHRIVRGEEGQDQKTKAFSAYQIGHYKEALPLLTELYATEKTPYYLFYRANALIQLNRAAEAIPLLQEHLKTKDKLTDKSNWYLAMAYLQLDDRANAKKMLNLVVEEGAFKVEEAQQLLEELD